MNMKVITGGVKQSSLLYAMKEKFITYTLKARISTNPNELHATKRSGGRYIKAMGVQGIVVKIRGIVVKYQDASWVKIEYFLSFLPLYRLRLLPCSLASG